MSRACCVTPGRTLHFPEPWSYSVKMQIIIPAQSYQVNHFEVSNTATKGDHSHISNDSHLASSALENPLFSSPVWPRGHVASMLHPQGPGPPAMPAEFKWNQAATTG